MLRIFRLAASADQVETHDQECHGLIYTHQRACHEHDEQQITVFIIRKLALK